MMLRHLDIRERQWRLRSYPSCFVGSECVGWMVSVGLVADAQAGVEVGSILIGYRVIQHVGGHFVFKHDDSLYQFILHTQQPQQQLPPDSTAAAAAVSLATSMPASLVTTPSHSSQAHTVRSGGGHHHQPTPLSFTHPTPEDELILSSLASSLHIRTHHTGLFHTPHPDTWRGSEALDWLVDSGVMRGEEDGLRWMRRMIRMGEVEVVDGGGSFKGVAGLYRFKRTDKESWERRRVVEGVQEEKEREEEERQGEEEEEEEERKARAEMEEVGASRLSASSTSPGSIVRDLQAAG